MAAQSAESISREDLMTLVFTTLTSFDSRPELKNLLSSFFDTSNQDIVDVWQWLVGLPDAQRHAIYFFHAAWVATHHKVIREGVADAKRREKVDFDSSIDPLGALFAASRKSGSQTDYVRAFRGELHRFNFPCSERGVQTAVLKVACIALQDEAVTPAVVSSVWREADKILKN